MNDNSSLEATIGIHFTKPEMLRTALTHRSYLNEHPEEPEHNERLEFLGDAVLELVVTDSLYRNYKNPEGDLTNWRAALVNSHMLAETATDCDLEKYLLLSKGEARDNNSKARQYIIANAFEALIGAIYMDQGYDKAKEFIEKKLLTKLSYILENKLYIDAKSKFQEEAQARTGITPSYRVLDESGPDHARHFKVGIYLDDVLVASGDGSSKQEAQMQAATAALKEKSWDQ